MLVTFIENLRNIIETLGNATEMLQTTGASNLRILFPYMGSYNQYDIQHLEMVQCQTTCFVLNNLGLLVIIIVLPKCYST